MGKFTPNPIIITQNDKPYKFLFLKYDVNEVDFIVEIKRKNNELLAKEQVSISKVIKIEKTDDEIILIYRDPKGFKLHEELVNISKNDLDTKEAKTESVYDKLTNLIKTKMDFPDGSEEEVKIHTEMLKKVSVDKKARIYITSKVRQILIGSGLLNYNEIEEYTYKLYSNLYGMGILQKLDDDVEVGEIMVNATTFPEFKADIYYIKNGIKYEHDESFSNLDELVQVFSRCIEFNKKELNSLENALIEATRENKDRVNIIIPEASENYIMNIRKFSNFIPNLDNMKKYGTVNSEIDELFNVLVQGKANIGIGGEMGTGKTTLINYLLTYTKPIERKVVIASVSETDVERVLKGHDVVILNVNEEKGFTFEKLMKASLRTTASRVIVPESRGSEFKQIYEANLKTKGNMFTAHALDDYSFLDICVDMYLSSGTSQNENSEHIKNKLAKSIDIIVIMKKVDDKIRIKSISEIVLDEKKQFESMNVLYEWKINPENPSEGHYQKTGNKISEQLKQRLNENGVPYGVLENL